MATKRFYIFTGKGGVGKTTLSLAFAKYLQDQGKNAKYYYFKTSKLDENSVEFNDAKDSIESLNINSKGLDLIHSAQNYIAKKLKSDLVASWIIKTPFFKSLINMIPGFNYLVYLGQTLQDLEDNQDLIVVLDSPSSGHALTMLESTKNFNQIFESGVIYNDTKRMLNLLNQDQFLEVAIVSLPSQLALNETVEFKKELAQIGNFRTTVICNNTLKNNHDLDLPHGLKTKIHNEIDSIKEFDDHIDYVINFSQNNAQQKVIKDLVPFMKNLV